MKRILLLVFLLPLAQAFAQPINVSTTTYTVPELVTDVLFGNTSGGSSSCAGTVSNIQWSTGTNFGCADNGIGYFTNTNPSFPMASGVVLVSGNANDTEGPNDETLSGGGACGWGGDAQLFNYIQSLGIDPGLSSYNNATVLEFDFTPLTDFMSFDFLFASEEYGTFQCSYSDAFAFFLTDVTAGTPATNLALVPNTTTPISVITIRDQAYNNGCSSENVSYFGNYYNNGDASAINFNGETILMTASSPVVPGHTYHIRFVIADRNDTALDSAVFLAGNSFDIGQALVQGSGPYDGLSNDFLVADGTAFCGGTAVTLEAGTEPITGATYQWKDLNGPIAGATSFDYTVTGPGTYTVDVTLPGGCVQTDSIIVEYWPSATLNSPVNLPDCDGDGLYDLTENEAIVLGTASPFDYAFSYYHSQPDAENGIDPIAFPFADPTSYPGAVGEDIFIRVDDNYGCFLVLPFELTDSATLVVNDVTSCGDYILPALPAGQTYHSAPGGAAATEIAAGTAISSDQVIYVYQNTGACQLEGDFTVDITTSPTVPNPADVVSCGSYTLPALPANQSYHSASGGAAATLIAANTVVSADQTIYVYVNNGPGCTAEGSFDIDIVTPPATPNPTDVTVCGSYTLPALPAGQTYHSAPGGSAATQIAAGTAITTTQTIYVFAQTGTSPNCTAEGDFVVTVNATPATPNPADVTVCDTYTLPALPAGQSYHSAPGGAAATQIAAGTAITSTQTIYVFAQTGTIPNCTAEGDFVVTVNATPTTPNPADVTACDSYVLPALAAGQTYHSAPGGSAATQIAAGTTITTTQTIYVFAQTGTTPNCTAEGDFVVTINATPATPNPTDVTVCDTYTLPALPAGQSYHSAPGGSAATQIAAGTAITTTQTIYVFAQTGTTPNCTAEGDFVVTVNTTPVIAPIADVVACDSYTLPALAVGNYFSAPNGTGTAYVAGDVITSSMTMYVYAQTGTTPNCFSQTSFNIGIFFAPAITSPTPYPLCDENNDGFACFDLTAKALEVTAGAPSLVATFHETSDDAQNGVNAVNVSNYCNIFPGTQTLYIRVTDALAPLCASFTTLQLQVNPVPVPNATVDTYRLCDVNAPGDQAEGFVLSSWDNEVTGGAVGVVVTYHLSTTDAQAGANAIDAIAPYQNTSNPQQICARIEFPATGCFVVKCFDLLVDPLPQVYAPAPMNACSGLVSGQAEFILNTNDAVVSGGVPGVVVSYHTSLADAQSGSGALASPYTNQTNPQTLFVRVQNATTGCFDTTTLTLNVTEGPVVFTPAALQECDPNNDGFTSFDLTQAIDDVMGGALPTGVTVTFHETQADAINGVLGWPSPYNNITPYNQTLYVRAEFDATGCASFTTLNLIVYDTPVATAIDALEVCDDNTDGIGSFDLTQATSGILGSLDPSQHTVTYHLTEQNAIDGVGAITGTLAFSSATGSVWVRVQENTIGCFDVIELGLVVNPRPVVPFPVGSYSLCDENNPGDKLEVFDLGSRIPDIVGTQTGMQVSFHLTAADAQAGVNDLPLVYTNAVPAVQTLYVRVENADTGCFSTSTMDIRVEPLPTPIPPVAPVAICDQDNDGFATIDLQALEADILQGAPGVTLAWYETEENARNGVDAIANPSAYLNIVPFTQQIWVGLQITATGCRNVMMVTLEVNPSPVVPPLDGLVECDQDTNPNDGRTFFDLTQQSQVITDALGAGYQIEYFESQAEAEAGVGAIVDADNYLSVAPSPQTIWVRVSDALGQCYGVGSFTLSVNTPLALTTPSALSVCDEGTPGTSPTTVFDLTVKNNEITGGLSGYTVTYYVTQADMLGGVNAIANPEAYTNIANAQTLFVAVTGPGPAGCRSFTTLTIRVLPLPSPQTDNIPPLEACDDNLPVGSELFDLTQNEDYMRQDDPNIAFEYYPTLADAQAQTNLIADPANYEATSGTIYIRVVRDTEPDFTGAFCGVIVEQPVVVHPLPQIVTSPVQYRQCDANGDGVEGFDLSASNAVLMDQILGPAQSTADFTVTFHLSASDAQSGSGALAVNYQNLSNPQDIFVRVVNDQTGCVNATGVVTLSVAAGATANPITIAPMCDDVNDGTNGTDGITAMDLTQYDADILGTQDATQFEVTYFTSLADALAGVNAITPASNYLAMTGSVYAVVTNNTTLCRSTPTEIQIVIEKLAAPQIIGDHSICVSFVTQQVLSAPILSVDPTSVNLSDYTFEWFLNGVSVGTGTSYAIIDGDAEGAYTVVATSNSYGCVSAPSVSHQVVKSGPAVPVSAGYFVSNPFADNQTITVTVDGYGSPFYQYQLDNGPIVDNGGVFTNVSPGEHTVTVYDMEGEGPHCDPAVITGIFVADYPTFFTPNGDGYNDTWNIVWPSNDVSPKIYIFDRYGKLLKQISSAGEGWDGTYNGAKMPSTDYWFSIQYTDQMTGAQKEFKAHFSLKR